MPKITSTGKDQNLLRTASGWRITWKIALFLTPFVYALVLAKWGSSLSTAWIIVFACVVVAIFLVAGLLYLREPSAKERIRNNFHAHPMLYLLAVALFSCTIAGTLVYLAVRPSHTGTTAINRPPAGQPLSHPTPSTAAPVPAISLPPIKTAVPTKAPAPHNKKPTTRSIPGTPQPRTPAAPLPTQHVDDGFIDNAPNNGTQTVEDNRQYGAPKPAPPIISSNTPEVVQRQNDEALMAVIQARGGVPPPPPDPYPVRNLSITVQGNFVHPAFRVTCDRPCTSDDGWSVNPNPGSRVVIEDYPRDADNTYIFDFSHPQMFPAGTKVTIQIRAVDRAPFRIDHVEAYLIQ